MMVAMLRSEDTSAPSPTSRWLVSTEWLSEHLLDRNVVVVDATYHLPTLQRDAQAEYRDGHIPGAVFFDIETVADHSTELPHMLPGPTQFGEVVSALGIGDGDTVVVYDSAGLYSAPRVWWTFRIFGANKVYILDGGLPKWKAEGRPLEKGAVHPNASPARRRSRALVCARATCRAPSTCLMADWSKTASWHHGRASKPRSSTPASISTSRSSPRAAPA
jgi:thiosulfate/3-mercaptopyruvate sulfurtransferase